jgi:hypothetical protein
MTRLPLFLALASLAWFPVNSQPLTPPFARVIAWGKSVKGLKIGASCDATVVASDNLPEIFFYAVNDGDKDIVDGIIQSGAECIVTVNGRPYAKTPPEDAISSYLPPGRQYGPIRIHVANLRRIADLKAWPFPEIMEDAPHPKLRKGSNAIVIYYVKDRTVVGSGEMQITYRSIGEVK